jgi:IS30 family transposase
MTTANDNAATIRAKVLTLHKEGKKPSEIAHVLGTAGFKTAQGLEFNEKRVYALIYHARSGDFQKRTTQASAMTTKRTRARTAYFRKPSGAGLHIEILRNGSLTANQKVAMLNAYFSRRAQGSTEA